METKEDGSAIAVPPNPDPSMPIPDDIPKVHKTSRETETFSSPDESVRTLSPRNIANLAEMREASETTSHEEEKDPELYSDWVAGGPLGAKGTTLVFRSCVLASKPPSMENVTKPPLLTGTAILLNKAKSMARRLTDGSDRPKINIMHEVMETFGTNIYSGTAYVVKHDSQSEIKPASITADALRLPKSNLHNVENTTARIFTPKATAPSNVSVPDKGKKEKLAKMRAKRKKEIVTMKKESGVESDESEPLLVKPADNIKVLETINMPARVLKITYKLVNTETKLLHRLLQAHGLTEAIAESKEFNLLWSGLHPKPDVLRSLTPYQRVNHFPRSYELTRKDRLFKNIEKMQYYRGFKHFDFIPTTFLMPNEYKELCTTHYRTKGPWIVKPAASSRGRGIYIVNSPEQIPKNDSVVVAKYIDKPLLIGGHKCDLRLYVCVTSIDPLLIYLYEEGLVRFATVKYDKTNKNLWNPCMHLCNYSINKYHTDYIKCDDPTAGNIGHKWTLSALLRYLKKQGRNTSALMASIEDLVVKSVLSSAQTISAAARIFVPNIFNCFELFGYDILVDDTLKPWLLEINLSPSLACESALDARVKCALIADTLTLVGLPAVPAYNPDYHKSGSLKVRIGACQRVHSAENVRKAGAGAGAGGGGSAGVTPVCGASLTAEEVRVVRAVKAQYARRGGFVRIFPSQDSWKNYSIYLDPITGVPVSSTNVTPGIPYAVVPHNYNLLVHANLIPNFRQNVTPNTATEEPTTPECDSRMRRYEAMPAPSHAHAQSVWQEDEEREPDFKAPVAPVSPVTTAAELEAKTAKLLVTSQLAAGLRLTAIDGRRAFCRYMSFVLKRISNPNSNLAVQHAELVLKFLKRASNSIRSMPFNSPTTRMSDKDKCAVISKQLNDFLYVYGRESDNAQDDDKSGDNKVSRTHVARFLHAASEFDLEEVLLLSLQLDKQVATFLDMKSVLYVEWSQEKRSPGPPPPFSLLKYLAKLTPLHANRHSILLRGVPAAVIPPPPSDDSVAYKELLPLPEPLGFGLPDVNTS